jgi:hypothetical protein
MNFRKFLLGCMMAWGAAIGALAVFDTFKHNEAEAAPALLSWGIDKGVAPANVCLYYTSTSCFNIGTMSAAGAFTLPLANLPAIGPEMMVGNQTGATAAPTSVQIPISQPMGRLTLQSGVPVMVSSTTGATTVYYTPYSGNQIPIPDGAGIGFINTAFAELSQLTTDATKSPAAVAANSCYDIFVWLDAGTVRATRGPAWVSCNSRGAAAGISRVNGLQVNTNAVTNGPAAKQGTWVGAISSNISSTIDYIYGTAASGGGNSRLEVCNFYNRLPTVSQVSDSGAGYTYNVATIRQARASTGNQVSFMVCLPTDSIFVSYQTECATTANVGAGCEVGIGLDTLTTYSSGRDRKLAPTAASLTSGQMVASYFNPGVGVHVVSANESSIGATANTFNNAGFNSLIMTINN